MNKSLLILVFFSLVFATQTMAQEKRTIWQKIFGKDRSADVDVEDPKTSKDSLAVLLNDHLGDSPEIDVEENDDKEEVKNPDTLAVNPQETGKGKVTFNVPSDVQNTVDTMKTHELVGYRIQVFLGEYSKARSIRSTFLNKGERATMEYNQSDYFVRIGDFKTYMAAQKMLAQIKKTYPGAYVVKDKIKVGS